MAARAIWKGVIHLGKLSVPVKLYSAVQDRDVHFTMLHDQELAPVRQKMIDTASGKPVERENAQRGVEVEPGRFVILRDEELEKLVPEASRDIAVESFIDDARLSNEWYERPYYLGPDEGAADDYFALATALEQTGREGLAQWVMRKKHYVGALRAERGYLMLITLRHPDEVIDAGRLDAPSGRKVDAKELKMAEQLVDALTDKFRPEDYRDEYRQRMIELIEKKAKGQKIKLVKPVEKRPPAKSLESVLKASLAAVSTAADDEADDEASGSHGRREPRKRPSSSAARRRGGRKERARG